MAWNAEYSEWLVGDGIISSIGYLLFSPSFALTPLVIGAGLGGLTVLGTFFFWKAAAISGSKTSVLAFSDDIIAILLSVVFLGEWEKVTQLALLGIGLCFLAIFGFVRQARAREKNGDASAPSRRFFLYVFLYSAIWGVSYFLQKVFAANSLGLWNLLGGWYLGGALMAWSVVRFADRNVKKDSPPATLPLRERVAVSLLALGLVTSMGLQYMIYHATLQLAAQPIFLVGEMVLQALVFLLFFPKERSQFDRVETACAFIALLGTLLIMGFQI